MEGMKWKHFMTMLLLDPYFKIKSWIYKGILEVLGSAWEFIREWNGMEWDGHKGMEMNGMEWNVFK